MMLPDRLVFKDAAGICKSHKRRPGLLENYITLVWIQAAKTEY